MNRLLFVFIWVVLGVDTLKCQLLQVYPGDINANGIVNNVDFLYLGLAYNFIGPERDPAPASNPLAFLPQPAVPWSYEFFSGTNFAHADCNGDGIVNYYYDAFPLYVNYGQTRPDSVTADVFPSGLQGVDPPLQFDDSTLPAFVNGGQHLSLPILLGDAQHPVEDLYGIAFSVFVDPEYVDADNVDFNFTELSWANPDNDRVTLYKKVSNERVDVAWVRTDHNQRNGFGRIGTADIIIIIDVIGVQQDFVMRIDSVKMIDKFGNQTAVAGDSVVLHMNPDDELTGTEAPSSANLHIRPNPVAHELNVSSAETIERLSLVNTLGQVVWQEQTGSTSVLTNLPSLPSGIYLLEIQTDKGSYIHKIKIQQ